MAYLEERRSPLIAIRIGKQQMQWLAFPRQTLAAQVVLSGRWDGCKVVVSSGVAREWCGLEQEW